MIHIINGNTLDVLKQLKDNLVSMVVTSPPYYMMRDYSWCDCITQRVANGVGNGDGPGCIQPTDKRCIREPNSNCKKCNGTGKIIGMENQIGLESNLDEYINKLVIVFREVRRVLRNDGTLWLNIGDCYNGSGKASSSGGHGEHSLIQNHNFGCLTANKPTNIPKLKKKDLIGIPWMLAFALRNDGWYLRSDCIWNVTNCLPH